MKEKNKKLFKLQNVTFKELDGSIVKVNNNAMEQLCHSLANEIYKGFPDISWLEISRSLYNDHMAELSAEQIEVLDNFIKSNNCNFTIFIKEAISNHLKELQK